MLRPTVTSVLKKHKRALQGSEDSKAYLRGLSENVDPRTRAKWDEQMSNAQRDRISKIDAMDVFDTDFEKGMLQTLIWDSLMACHCRRSYLCPKTIGTHAGRN
jgi:S-adenosylmethionine:diacylglycerol 3-amino-3-carboxypropyl transferase